MHPGGPSENNEFPSSSSSGCLNYVSSQPQHCIGLCLFILVMYYAINNSDLRLTSRHAAERKPNDKIISGRSSADYTIISTGKCSIDKSAIVFQNCNAETMTIVNFSQRSDSTSATHRPSVSNSRFKIVVVNASVSVGAISSSLSSLSCEFSQSSSSRWNGPLANSHAQGVLDVSHFVCKLHSTTSRSCDPCSQLVR